MKSNNCQENILAARVRTVVAAMAVSMVAAASAQAAPTSFPQYPLLTGGEAIPPNIMLILDDSGSMDAVHMPTDRYDLSDSVRDRAYVNNTLYYNPDRDYKPWRKSSTDLNDRLGNANFRSVSTSTTSVSGGSFDLRNQSESYFYVPRSGVSNPGNNSSNYDKYRIASSSSANSYNGGVVQKQVSRTDVVASGTVSIPRRDSSACFAVPVDGADTVTFLVSGSKDANIYVFSNSNCSSNSQLNSDASNDNPKSLSISVSSRSWVYLQIRNSSNSSISNINYSASAYKEWEDATPVRTVKDKDGNVLPPRAQIDELQNFANWYHYHRSRNKMAKAGASEAFGRLGKNYRVGFDTIWNRRNGSIVSVRGSQPAFPIPTATNDGLFESANRNSFYDHLQGATASGNTPLHGALQRAGRYFQTDAPWKDSSGNMLSCRQNYALLTTDGYWNQANYDGGYTPAVGNSDLGSKHGDSVGDTLADVAYEFWKKDLRADLGDNVRPTGADPATWQHMVTFGISIGLQGTLDPTQEPPAAGRWPNPITNSGAARIDDLWHASLNGHGSFVVATDTDKFAAALTAALSAIDSRSASGSNIASSSTKTESSTLTFVAGFTSVSWIGDLIASPFNAALTGVSDTPLWALSKTFGAGGVNRDFVNRTVLTSFGGTAQQFTSNLPSSGVFARSGTADAVTAADNIDYLRGDQSKEEGRVGGVLRKRAYPLGDIVDSSPNYVEDTNTVYVGANDGMLHGIRATDGKVLFSYVPKGLDFAAMAGLSAPSYEHRYFVDGQIDVISRVNQGSGRNILVGALGRGGRGVFALNVTNPASMGASSVLWDETFQTPASGTDPDRDMGYVLGAVRIRKGNGGKTYALVPNGIDSPNGSATLYAYELAANGAVTRKHTLIADTGTGNGLMSTGMADFNGDGLIDVVYGGDLKGNVWRWDFEGTNPGAAVKLFQAKDAGDNPQPITGGLAVGRDTSGQVFVGFGTGKFISNTDVPAPGITSQTQSIYGIIDTGTTITARSQLEARTIPFSGKTAKGEDARGFENYSVLPSSKRGWYIDLPVPERVTSAPTVYGSAMYLASVIPATGADCSGAAGSGFVNALNLFTGTSPKSGGYFTDQTGLKDKDGNPGVIGSVGISGGMPTEVNVTSSLATVGTGQGPSDLSSGTSSSGINPPTGGRPSRISWREIVAQ